MVAGGLEKVVAGWRIRPDDGEPPLAHSSQVVVDLLPLRELCAVAARGEGAVRDAAEHEALAANGEELAVHGDTSSQPPAAVRRFGNRPRQTGSKRAIPPLRYLT